MLISINATESSWKKHRFILWFGACDPTTNLLVWADHLEDALDECIDWIADPKNECLGLLADAQVAEVYAEACAEGLAEEAAHEVAEVDTTSGGNSGHYLLSWEWGILAEDPDRATILELQERDRWRAD